MAAEAGAYLVVRLEVGFGEVFELTPGERCTLGRASTNRIVVKDELCSREHAEVYFRDAHWWVRDLKSLNGTHANQRKLEDEWQLSPTDEIHLGHTRLVFVETMEQLPELPITPPDSGSVSIIKRLHRTRFMTPLPPTRDVTAEDSSQFDQQSQDLSRLYRLSLNMGSAHDKGELVTVVLNELMDAIPADVGAILEVKEGREVTLLDYRHRDPKSKAYDRVSEFVSKEVLESKEAILAENVNEDRHLRNRESLSDIGVFSLICAPIKFKEDVLALIHLYRTDPIHSLDSDHLEFAVAVAEFFGRVLNQINRQQSLEGQNEQLRDQLRVESELVGLSPPMKEIESQIGRVASTNATVLIRGESGAGKELVARAIHYSSRRKDGPFICLNCAALTETLLESELFGHEKGSFTGATERKIGKFEAADLGTIFLDEIGEMSIGTQAKLLRVIEGHPFERVGGGTQIKVDVRVVAATNQPLEQAIQNNTFRRDLFYRLQVVEIRVPPLRDRPTDVPILAEHFLRRFVRETGRKIRDFTPAAQKKMQEYHWPGNVRELRNVVERAVALSTGNILDAADIWLSSLEIGTPAPLLATRSAAYRAISLDEMEKEHILQTLEHTDWNKSQAAAILRIERSTLDRKIKAYELKR